MPKEGFSHAARVLVWMAACGKGATVPVIKAKTLTHTGYIRKCLPRAHALGRRHFGRGWWLQQDNATPHTHWRSQQWCRSHVPRFFNKNCWPPNSPDLNPCDYAFWAELGSWLNWSALQNKKTLVRQIQAASRKLKRGVLTANFIA